MDFSHGTKCAGEIAAEADNGICGAGISHEAKIGGKFGTMLLGLEFSREFCPLQLMHRREGVWL